MDKENRTTKTFLYLNIIGKNMKKKSSDMEKKTRDVKKIVIPLFLVIAVIALVVIFAANYDKIIKGTSETQETQLTETPKEDAAIEETLKEEIPFCIILIDI